jgi:phosphatidylglycerophosphate synthase
MSKETENGTPQNSRLRRFINGASKAVVEKIHEINPNITPNQITMTGAALSTVIALCFAGREIHTDTSLAERFAWGIPYAFFALTDLLDGAMARLYKEKGIARTEKVDGNLMDSMIDRGTETARGLARMAIAASHGNVLGLTTASLATITSITSSLTRAYAETQGVAVHENGKNLFQMIGSYGGRMPLSSVALFFPEVQPVIDGAISIATTAVAYDRFKSARTQEPTLDQEFIQIAEQRAKLIGLASMANTTLAVSAFVAFPHIF